MNALPPCRQSLLRTNGKINRMQDKKMLAKRTELEQPGHQHARTAPENFASFARGVHGDCNSIFSFGLQTLEETARAFQKGVPVQLVDATPLALVSLTLRFSRTDLLALQFAFP
jgi:hypothetical protein